MELQANKHHLENEKNNFLITMNEFINGINFEQEQFQGRPRANLKTILKCLLVMSYCGLSYRRSHSDIVNLYQQGLIESIPKKATIGKYMLDEEIKKILQDLIPFSARTFMDVEDTLLVDSTWFHKFIKLSGSNKRKLAKGTAKLPPLSKTRKLHVMCFLKSQMIISVRASIGTAHDNNFFREMLQEVLDNGFKIKRILGDSAYLDKKNMILCEENNIKDVFIDFRSNVRYRRGGSGLWKERLKIYKENPELWHENYRFRVKIEGLFSTMKRKGNNYIRSRKDNSQDVELLLKALWHNLTIISKFIGSL